VFVLATGLGVLRLLWSIADDGADIESGGEQTYSVLGWIIVFGLMYVGVV
jgi:hypothetical protein